MLPKICSIFDNMSLITFSHSEFSFIKFSKISNHFAQIKKIEVGLVLEPWNLKILLGYKKKSRCFSCEFRDFYLKYPILSQCCYFVKLLAVLQKHFS